MNRYAGPRRLIKKKKDAAALHAAAQQQNINNGTLNVNHTTVQSQSDTQPVGTQQIKYDNKVNDDNKGKPSSVMPGDDEVGTLLGDYQLMEGIGKGGFGIVYRGLHIVTGRTVAIKRISLYGIPSNELEGIEAEITLLKNLCHSNIVLYYDSIRTAQHLNIVLEYCENGSLSTLLSAMGGKLPEPLVSHYTAQVLSGLHYLHTQGVIHRDIKGANILANKDGSIKLADFGVATKLNDTMKSDSVVGTPYWMAPEIIAMSGEQSSSCDIWSVGCTVIELLTGKPPYFDLQQMAALFRIVQDEHPPLPDNISNSLQDFLMQCFQKDPNRRIDAQGLLKHNWLKNTINNNNILNNNSISNNHNKLRVNNSTMKPAVDELLLDSDEDWDAEIEAENHQISTNNVNTNIHAQLITPDVMKQFLQQNNNINNSNNQPQTSRSVDPVHTLTSPNRSVSLALTPNKFELSPLKPSDLMNSKAVVMRKHSTVSRQFDVDDDIDDTTILDGIDDDQYIITSAAKQSINNHQHPQPVHSNKYNIINNNHMKPRGLHDFVESEDTADDYEFDDLSDNTNGTERHLTLARHNAHSTHNTIQSQNDKDDIFDDTFDTSISETSMNSVKLHINQHELNDPQQLDTSTSKQITRLMNSLQLSSSDNEQLIALLTQLIDLVHDNTAAATYINTISCIQLIDIIISHTSHDVVLHTLKLINSVCVTAHQYTHTLCLNGIIPSLITLCSSNNNNEFDATELLYLNESVQFIHTLLQCNTEHNKQSFLSTNAVQILIHTLYLPPQHTVQHIALLSTTIDCLHYVFNSFALLNKNTLCRLMMRYNILFPLTQQLYFICSVQHQLTGGLYRKSCTQLLSILTLYSNSDQPIKQYYSTPCIINNILCILQLNYKSPQNRYVEYIDCNTITILLKSIKNISMDSSTLDNLESTTAIQTLLLYLNATNTSEHQATVLLSMYYLCQIKQSRQEQAAVHGIIPHLIRIIRDNHSLKQFAYPIIMLLGKSTQSTIHVELKKHNSIQFYLSCLSDLYWCVHALEVLCCWLQHDKLRTEHYLMQYTAIIQLVKCSQLCAEQSAQQYEMILPSIRKLISESVAINLALGSNIAFIQQLTLQLSHTIQLQHNTNNTNINKMRVNLLKIIALLVIPTDTRAVGLMIEYGMCNILHELVHDGDGVIVKKLAEKLLDTRFHVNSSSISNNNINNQVNMKKSLVTSGRV